MSAAALRVVVAEDEALLREGLTLVLTGAGLAVVGTAGSAPELLELVDRTDPDLVVTDIRMPPDRTDDGLRAALHLRRTRPGTAVMVLSQFVQRRYALELLADERAGVGYLLKQRIVEVEQFVDDLRTVAAGATVLDPDVVEVLLRRASVAERGSAVDRLTARQRQVLQLVAEGRTNSAIADVLRVSERGVVQHLSNIYSQLGLAPAADDHRRVLAVIRYLEDRQGLDGTGTTSG